MNSDIVITSDSTTDLSPELKERYGIEICPLGVTLGGKTYIGGMLLEPGRVQATIPGKDTFIGELDGSVTERTRAIGAAFEEAGMHCIVSDNIMGVIWDKLLVNVATGAVCGITHLPFGDMFEDEKLVACSCAAVREGMDVAKAAGVQLT